MHLNSCARVSGISVGIPLRCKFPIHATPVANIAHVTYTPKLKIP